MKKTLLLTMTINEKGRGVFMDENMEEKISAEDLMKMIKDQHHMKKHDVLCIKIISANTKYEQTAFSMDQLKDIVSGVTPGGVMTTRGIDVQILKTDMRGTGPILGVIEEDGADMPLFWDEQGRSTNPEHYDGRYDLVLFHEKEKN